MAVSLDAEMKTSADACTDVEVFDISNESGYRAFRAGQFHFSRDEYFAYIRWPTGSRVMAVDAFLRALMRDVAWGFFYGTVAFDPIFGTVNHYGTVTMYAGKYDEGYIQGGRAYEQLFDSAALMGVFKQMLADWVVEGFDPFAAPKETGLAWGPKNGGNDTAINRQRVTARRMVGLPGDTPIRTDENGYPVNRDFADVDQSQPLVEAEPGFEGEVSAFNLFGYLSRSDVTWNPSVCSVLGDSLFCPTSEEFILPIEHGNDRCEWFMQFSDQIDWEIKNKDTGRLRARVTMKPGDIACMPADIRHQGFSTKRSMLLVWENGSPDIPDLIKAGKAPVVSVSF